MQGLHVLISCMINILSVSLHRIYKRTNQQTFITMIELDRQKLKDELKSSIFTYVKDGYECSEVYDSILNSEPQLIVDYFGTNPFSVEPEFSDFFDTQDYYDKVTDQSMGFYDWLQWFGESDNSTHQLYAIAEELYYKNRELTNKLNIIKTVIEK